MCVLLLKKVKEDPGLSGALDGKGRRLGMSHEIRPSMNRVVGMAQFIAPPDEALTPSFTFVQQLRSAA